MKIETHGVEIEVEEGAEVVGVIQTSSGTVLILENNKGAYAVYSPVKSKITHIHVPLEFIEYSEGTLELKVEVRGNIGGLQRVLADVSACIKSGNCYIDTIEQELRSSMPIVSWFNKKKYEECVKKYNDEDLCSVYLGAPIRLMGINYFWSDSTTTPLELKKK